MRSGTTGTGLDQMIEVILNDPGLNRRLSEEQIAAGAEAADKLNGVVIDAIRATGVANDGDIDGGDLIDIGLHMENKAGNRIDNLLGNNSPNSETGFELIEDEGSTTFRFGTNAVNNVLGTFYELGNGADDKGNLLDENGEPGRRLGEVGSWLNNLLADDLAAGTLENPNKNYLTEGTTGTKLDQVIEDIWTDPEIVSQVSAADRQLGAVGADWHNNNILEAVEVTGVATDRNISVEDARLLNEYINFNYEEEFAEAHGFFRDGVRTGWHSVVGFTGNDEKVFGFDGWDYVWDSLYHIGFDVRDGRLTNANGDLNVSFTQISRWLNVMLEDEIASGRFDEQKAPPPGATWPTGRELRDNMGPPIPPEQLDPDVEPNTATGTLLDQFIDLIYSNDKLPDSVSDRGIDAAAAAAETMNVAIVDAIEATGVAADGRFTNADTEAINRYLREETDLDWHALRNPNDGFDTIVNKPAGFTFIQGERSFNDTLNGFYNIGFRINDDGRFVDRNGEASFGVGKITNWLNAFFEEDIADGYFDGTGVQVNTNRTGTGLDQISVTIAEDDAIASRLAPNDIAEAVATANDLNAYIVQSIRATGAANDGEITGGDLIDMNRVLSNRFGDEFEEAYGSNTNGERTGLQDVMNRGSTETILGMNAINEAYDGVWRLGLEIDGNKLVGENTKHDRKLTETADVLDELLADDLEAGTLVNDSKSFVSRGTTDTGLDRSVDMMLANDALKDSVGTSALHAAASAANQMNSAILTAIDRTDAGADGTFTNPDIIAISESLRSMEKLDWAALRNDDDGAGPGFDAVVGANSGGAELFGDPAFNRVFDSVYNIGFGIEDGRFLDQDGNQTVQVTAVRDYLNRLLDDELANDMFVA